MSARYRYLPLAKIASGGTATVYIGARRASQELVALKRPHPHILEDPRQRVEVLREARVAALLHHPNIAGVRAVEAEGDEIQLVMDYVEGAALGSLIAAEARRDARLPVAVAVRVLLDACEGLAAVHAQKDAEGRLLGLVHRDVSPQNILVGLDGVARLTDFGLAKAVYAGAPSTTQGTLKGKLGYMAPEYVQRGEVDLGVDVFAMGVVLWETLAGRRLFRGDNEAQTLDRILREDPSPLAALVPELAPFDPVVAAATRKDPRERLASAVALRDAIGEAAARSSGQGRGADVALYVQAAVGDELRVRRAEAKGALRRRDRGFRAAVLASALVGGAAAALLAWRGAVSVPSQAPPAASSASSSLPAASPVAVAPVTHPEVAPSASAAPPASSASASTSGAPPPPATPRPRPPRPAPAPQGLPPNPYDRATR